MNRKTDNLDERQLIIHARAFKHAFLILLLLVCFTTVVSMAGVVWTAEGGSLVGISAALCLLYCEFIFYEVFPVSRVLHIIFVILLFLYGLSCIVHTVYTMGRESIPFIVNSQLSNEGAFVLSGALFCIPLVFGLFCIIFRKSEDEE